MDKVGVILIVLFLIIIVLGPMFCASITRSRDKPAKVYNPQADDLGKARQQLDSVTTCSRAGKKAKAAPNDDVETSISQAELGECPICIGPLIPAPAPAHIVDNHVRPKVESEAVLMKTSPPKPNANEGSGHELGQLGPTVQETELVEEDDVLALNSCGHSFHSKCLASWFLIQRHDCPVCRVPYYTDEKQKRRPGALSLPSFSATHTIY